MFTKKKKKVQIELLKTYSVSIKLGGKIPTAKVGEIDKNIRKLLKNNNFESVALFLRLQLGYAWDEGLLIPVEIESNLYYNVPAKRMKKIEIRDNRERIIGYRFYYRKHFLFQTDADLVFTSNFTLLADGITRYHPAKAVPILRTLRRVPEEVQFPKFD